MPTLELELESSAIELDPLEVTLDWESPSGPPDGASESLESPDPQPEPSATSANQPTSAGACGGEAVADGAGELSDGAVTSVARVADSPLNSPAAELSRAYDEVADLRDAVAEAALKVDQCRAETKAAKDALKLAIEEFHEAQVKLDGLERAANQCRVPQGLASDATAPESVSRSEGDAVGATEAGAIDAGGLADLSVLKISKGRMEILREADMGGGRSASTVADLEALIRDGRLQHLKGFGPKAVDSVTDALMEWRAKNPVPRVDDPPIDDRAKEFGSPSKIEDGTPKETDLTTVASLVVPVEATAEGDILIDVPPDLLDEDDPAVVDAYTAGCEAAVNDQVVTTNPHKMGTLLWKCWDRGWQDCNAGGAE